MANISIINTQLVDEIDQYLKRLFPITRSITGNGNRETLKILQELVPLEIKEYSSGLSVYDWVIPDEWKIRDAWIKDMEGNKLIDFQQCNIHLMSYSEPISGTFSFDELEPHLYYHETLPDAVPYRTTYYKKDWGFCVTQKQYKKLQEMDGKLTILIDSSFDPDGGLTIGELLVPGESDQEILISTYICHPSLANDNLSGVIMTTFLARELLKQKKMKRSYRIVWVPETIGAIAYCAMNEVNIKNIQSGLVVTTVGGSGHYGYKQSFNPDHSINNIIEEIFNNEGIDFETYPFDIHGSDERQYSSQGFRINMASIHRDKYYEYPYYHSSLDDLDFVKPKQIEKSLLLHLKVLDKLNFEPVYKSNYPNGEVMLSKHDLYSKTGGGQLPQGKNLNTLDIILWLLWMCDGSKGLIHIARKLNIKLENLDSIAKELNKKGLLEKLI
jgi:aminopeptidase-like protein